MKPACAACRKTAATQGRKPEEVVCEYDDEISNTRKGSRKSSGEKQDVEINNNNNNNANTGGNGPVKQSNSSTNDGHLRRPSPYAAKSSNQSRSWLTTSPSLLREQTPADLKNLHFLNTGDYSNSLHNGEPNNVTPDIPSGMFAFSGMDWIGASSFGSYPTFNTSSQNQGRSFLFFSRHFTLLLRCTLDRCLQLALPPVLLYFLILAILYMVCSGLSLRLLLMNLLIRFGHRFVSLANRSSRT